MVTRTDYPKTEVEACLSVIVELMTVLGEYRDSIVLVGGWVPYFLIDKKKQEHTGSLDIDIALDFTKISNEAYATILNLLKKQGFKQNTQPFIFTRTINSDFDNPIAIKINLLAAEYGGTGKSHRTQKVQDIRPRKARGCDLVFEHTFSVSLSKKMPDGAINEIVLKVASVIPFLVMKGMALWDRYKEKDAYDIYFTVSNYPGGIKHLIDVFKPHKSSKLVQEGLGKIKAKFDDINSPGPVWVINFFEIDDEEEKERIKRDAFEKTNAFLNGLNIEIFRE